MRRQHLATRTKENDKMKKITVYLVRHGQSEHNLSGSLCDEPITTGILGSSLTEEGKRQARLLAQKLKHLHIDCLLSSPLNRARQTAEIFSEVFSIPVITNEMLQERMGEENEQDAGLRLLALLQETVHQ